jgi:hypothetical protein
MRAHCFAIALVLLPGITGVPHAQSDPRYTRHRNRSAPRVTGRRSRTLHFFTDVYGPR